MQAFSNEDIKTSLCGGCDCTGFTPAVTFAYDGEDQSFVITDGSTYPSGDSRKIVHITISDKNGKKVVSSIAFDDVDNAVSVDASSLDASGGLTVAVTVVTDKGCISDGHIDAVGINVVAGALGYWDKDNNAIK